MTLFRLLVASIGSFAGLGLGCDEVAAQSGASTSEQMSRCSASLEYAGQAERANSAIRKALATIDAPCPVDGQGGGPCDLVHSQFELPKELPKKSQQRILLMDGGMTLPALTRYRSRVIDFLEFDERGELHRINEEVVLPKLAHEILVNILDKEFPELPPCLLGPVQHSFEEKLSASINAHNSADHGDVIFTKLAELNPSAHFVLVRDPKSSIDVDDCADWERLRSKRSQLASAQRKSLQNLINRYQITHINFSFSPTFEHRLESLRASCPTLEITPQMVQRTIKDDLNHFFEPIFSTPGVMSAQAIHLRANYELAWMREVNTVDCTPLPGRLRIGAYGLADSNVPPEGVNTFELFQNETRASAPCVDLAINLGSTQFNEGPRNPPSVFFSWTGVETAPGFNIGSSWAAPLALSYLIYLQSIFPLAKSGELIRLATNDGQGRLKDPVKHKQFEIFRLGYMN